MKDQSSEIQRRARELIKAHGGQAKSVAQHKMMERMRQDDPKAASYWLAIMYEIHRTEKETTH